MHRFYTRYFFVYIHGDKFGLIESSLKFIGNNHDAIFSAFKSFAHISAVKTRIHVSFRESMLFRKGRFFYFFIRNFARKSHDSLDISIPVTLAITLELQMVFNSRWPRRSYDHGFGLAGKQVSYILAEVLDNHRNFLRYVGRVQRNPFSQSSFSAFLIDSLVFAMDKRIAQTKGDLVAGIVLENVQNKAFFNSLLHGIQVEWRRGIFVAHRLCRLKRAAEKAECRMFWCSREGKITGIVRALSRRLPHRQTFCFAQGIPFLFTLAC